MQIKKNTFKTWIFVLFWRS